MWTGLVIALGALAAQAAPQSQWEIFLGRNESGIIEVALPGEVSGSGDLPWRSKGEAPDRIWSVPMKVLTHGGITVGDRFSVRGVDSKSAPRSCKVTSFVTRSVAYDDVAPEKATAPTCGVTQVYAQLDCPATQREMVLVTPEAVQITAYSKVPAKASPGDGGAKTALSTPEIMAQVKAGLSREVEPGTPMKTTFGHAKLSAHPKLSVVDVHRYTGEGMSECGGDDYSDARWALWDGQRVVGATHRNISRPKALLTVSDRVYVMRSLMGNGWALTDLDGQVLYTLHSQFCGCAC